MVLLKADLHHYSWYWRLTNGLTIWRMVARLM